MSQTELAKRCGWESQSRISMYERNAREPQLEDLRRIARALGVPVDALVSDEGLSEVDTNLAPAPRQKGLVPLISWVKAGGLTEAIDLYEPGDAEDWYPAPGHHGPNTFALRVQGDSMTNPYPGQKSYPAGVIIYVDPDTPAQNGSRVVAKLLETDEVTFKVYSEDAGMKFLKPLNPQYPTIQLHDGFEVIGVVIGSYFPE